MERFLKLVGSENYNSLSTGLVRKDQVIVIEDNDDLADRLLEKGTTVDEDFVKPTFKEVARPAGYGRKPAAKKQAKRIEEDDERTDMSVASLDPKRRPQAPMGLGPNGAERDIDLHEVDSEMDGVKDEAYHDEEEQEEEGDDNQGDDSQGDDNQGDDNQEDGDNADEAPAKAAAAPKAPKATATRVRAPKAK